MKITDLVVAAVGIVFGVAIVRDPALAPAAALVASATCFGAWVSSRR